MPTIRQRDVPPDVWAKLTASAGITPVAQPKGTVTLVAASFVPPGTWVIPLHLPPVTNGGAVKRGAIGRAAKDRRAVAAALVPTLREVAVYADAVRDGKALRCRITRLGGGLMDDDNLPPAAKWVRDTIALFTGVGDGPRGPVRWEYRQEPGGPCGVRVELTTLEG